MDPCRVSSFNLPFLLGEMPVAFTQAESGFQLNLFRLWPCRLSVPAASSLSETVQGFVIRAPPRVITTQKEEEQGDVRQGIPMLLLLIMMMSTGHVVCIHLLI